LPVSSSKSADKPRSTAPLYLTPAGRATLATAYGMGVFLDIRHGVGGWVRDGEFWVAPDRSYAGPGRRFVVYEPGGDWHVETLAPESVQ
jgi:hypothetical protein